MSKKGTGPPLFAKSKFDILNVDYGNDHEDEQEDVEEPVIIASTSEAPPTPLSKSAKKRLAKAAARLNASASEPSIGGGAADRVPPNAAEAVAGVVEGSQEQAGEVVQAATETLSGPANGSRQVNGHGDNVVQGGVDKFKDQAIDTLDEILPELPSAVSEDPTPRPEQPVAKPVRPSPRSIGSSFTIPPPSPSSPLLAPSSPSQPNRKSSFSQQIPSSDFSPALPDALPQPSSNALPSNRKRKTPQDFTPSGANAETPSSPNKIGVKFEDGLAPGEGKEGEKVIPKKVEDGRGLMKNKNVVERTVWTFIMIGGFIGLLCLGHPYLILLVMLCQTLVYNEVTALFELRDAGTKKTDEDGWSKTLNWYFFVVTNYFLYGESIIYYFKHIVFVDAIFIPFARNHRFISFMLYVVGFVGFVANLQRQYLRQQFALFCWVHISLLLIVVSSHFIVNNILEGLVWFFVPASLVICNDIWAYICGKMFGRTPLIKLSPKKTVEGFIGAYICTSIFALGWGTFFMRFPYMICPARDLGTNILSNISCRPNPVFVWRDFAFTGPAKQILQTVLGHAPPSIPNAPFQIHCLVMATFASLVAPFGGFFASGFKRAFNIKDFGHSIPGHGGMTDRMDCQFMMGMFSYVYYSSLIRVQYVTVGSIMQTVVTSLSGSEQLKLLSDLKRFLEGQGLRVKG